MILINARPRSFPLIAVLWLVCGTVAGGCTTPTSIKQPTATFKTMNVTGITATGFTMGFDVDVQNPNEVPLPLSQTDYKLALGGVDVVEGKAKPEGTLPANGSLAVTLPVTVTYENLLAAEGALSKGGGKIPYAFSGAMGVGGGRARSLLGQSTSVPLKYEGTLDLKSLLNDPKTLMKSPAGRKLAEYLLQNWLSR